MIYTVIELRMLGEIRLLSADGAELDALLRQPKRLALLAYLASPNPGTWHRRDMLLALFWPDFNAGRARTSLRNALYVLRRTLGDQVIRARGDEEISVDPAELRTDVATVWNALRGGRTDEAIANYGGDLLPGLFPPDSDGFQRWLDTERTRLKVAVVTNATARVNELEGDGKTREALAIARRMLEIEPDDETIVRRMMTLHESIGDMAGALAVFEHYRTRLATDFEAEPAPETLAIVERLRASRLSAAPRTRGGEDRPQSQAPVSATPNATASTESQHVEFGAPRHSRTRAATFAAAALAFVAVITAAALSFPRTRAPLAIGRTAPVTSEEGLQIQSAISPNGRLVAYAKGNVSQLRIFVQKIGGGTPWPLTDDSTAFEIFPRWAPDNDQILFLSHNHAYVTPSIGGTPRIVARGEKGDGMVRSASWSPSGDSVAIVRNDSLLVRPLRGSGARFVGSSYQLHSCVWSPNQLWFACVSGNWIAYEPGPLFGNEAQSEIVLFPAAGGRAIALTKKDYEHRSPAWSADGDFLWMISNRDGAAGEVYAMRIAKDGKMSGSFDRVGVRAESISLSAGRIAYSVPVHRANIWAIDIPGDSLVTLSKAKQLTTGNQVIEVLNASRDGKWLVYDSNLHGDADIYRMPTSGGSAERLTDDPRPEYAGSLSPGGEELAWQRWVKGERHVFVKRLESDSAVDIVPDAGDQGVPRWSPNGRSLVSWSHARERGMMMVMNRDARGKWKPQWKSDGGTVPDWSPDSRSLAFVLYDGSIETMPADSGTRRRVYTPRKGTDDPIATFIVWNLDPSIIWFIGRDAKGRGGIWSIPANGGTPRQRVRFDDPIGRSPGPTLTSDGSRFYFTLAERLSNVRWGELTRK